MITDRIMADHRRNEIAGYEHGSLVNQLVKRMLPICSRLPPYHRTGCVVYFFSVPVCALTITFHIPLLEISCKSMHILVVRKDSFCLCAKEICIPQTN